MFFKRILFSSRTLNPKPYFYDFQNLGPEELMLCLDKAQKESAVHLYEPLVNRSGELAEKLTIKQIRLLISWISKESRVSKTSDQIVKKLVAEFAPKFGQLTALSCASFAQSFARLKIRDDESLRLLGLAYLKSMRELKDDADLALFLPQTFAFIKNSSIIGYIETNAFEAACQIVLKYDRSQARRIFFASYAHSLDPSCPAPQQILDELINVDDLDSSKLIVLVKLARQLNDQRVLDIARNRFSKLSNVSSSNATIMARLLEGH